ncbi:slit homolog 3 protein-like isoform X2 [Dermacentor silvarum]|uniref:slit homolog 3 protein-like isoform X2 n=1 Tax=Dermacentor silvarum TaxID=543639 RepID=UPI00210096C3|nr:slit homolog 3 protein-like isoform X2 [Dermacentor silvarum]
MLSSTAKTLRRIDWLAFVLVTCTYCSSEAKEWRRANATCPKLSHCQCTVVKKGALTSCRNVVKRQELDADMAKLAGIVHSRLTFDDVQITELPASWFSNHSVIMLVVKNSPLREIETGAVSGIDRLSRLLLEKDQIEVVPYDLSAAKRLRWLYIRKNHIRSLQGMLSLPELFELDLRFNAIETIDEKYFSGMANLRSLLLSSNKIQHLPRMLFKDTKKLKYVEFRSNRITMINALFDDLRYLEVLDLSRNVITDIDDLMASRMPYLKTINLEDNRINVIPEISASNAMIERVLLNRNQINEVRHGAFASLEAMSRVEMSNNSLSSLDKSVFHADSKLEHLALSGNDITSIRGTFRNIHWIKELVLAFNEIEDITDAFKELALLRVLSLRNNFVSHVRDGTFSDNPGLVEINLSNNKIQWIGRNAFKGLVTLNKLILHGNQLLSLNGSVSNLLFVQYLDASFNAIQSLEEGEFSNNGHLTYIQLAYNNISGVRGAFTGATSLVGLVLRGNQVRLLRRTDFTERLTTKPTLTLDDNPLMCDCRLAWLLGRNSEVRTRSYPKCESPPWLKGTLLRNLTRQQVIRWQDNCELGCRCDCREDSLGERTIAVDCSSAALNRTPQAFPEDTTRLELRDNRIEGLDDALIKGAPRLEVLSLRNNLLTGLNVTQIPESVRSLDLSGNRMKRLPYDLVTGRNLVTLRLSANPFVCECTDYPFRQWIEAHGHTILDAGDIVCAENPNSPVSSKAFATLGQKELCPAAVPGVIAYLLPVLGILCLPLVAESWVLQGGRVPLVRFCPSRFSAPAVTSGVRCTNKHGA